MYDYYLESYVNLCTVDKITWLGVGRWAVDGPYTLPVGITTCHVLGRGVQEEKHQQRTIGPT